jgi:hypothetical protein
MNSDQQRRSNSASASVIGSILAATFALYGLQDNIKSAKFARLFDGYRHSDCISYGDDAALIFIYYLLFVGSLAIIIWVVARILLSLWQGSPIGSSIPTPFDRVSFRFNTGIILLLSSFLIISSVGSISCVNDQGIRVLGEFSANPYDAPWTAIKQINFYCSEGTRGSGAGALIEVLTRDGRETRVVDNLSFDLMDRIEPKIKLEAAKHQIYISNPTVIDSCGQQN